MGQQCLMKSGHQWRTLPAKRNIATPKITDYGHARLRHNLVVVADLQGMRCIADRLMPDRLSVTADGDDILRAKLFFMHQGQYRIGKQRPQPHIKLTKLRKRQLLPLTDTENVLFQRQGDRPGQARLLCHHVFINSGQNDVYAIQTGTRHHTNVATRFHALSLRCVG